MISGQIIKILTQKDNDWGRYKIESAGKVILAVGVIPGASLGADVVIDGYDEHTKYGDQFTIKTVLSTTADSLSGARRFLADGYIKGIGLTKANAILRAFGKDAIDLLDTKEGQKRLMTIKGISDKTIEKCLPSYNKNKKYKDIVLFLNGCGTKAQVEKIYDKYGNKTLSVLKENPYRLQMDLDGFGFIKADNIALSSGIKPDSPNRIMAAVKYLIEDAQSAGGHCYLTVSEIRDKIAVLLCPMPPMSDITQKVAENAATGDWTENKEKLIKAHNPCADTIEKISQTIESRENILSGLVDAMDEAIKDGALVNYDGKIYTTSMYELEQQTAKMILQMCSQNPVRFIKPELIDSCIKDVEKTKSGINGMFVTTDEQKRAIRLGLMNRISIISGGPGRGKTAIAEIIAKTFLSAGYRYDEKDVIMLAPTGRAAQRILESTGYDAMTVHRAVGAAKGKGITPKNKLVLVDESSMVDIFLMNSILKYAKDCNLIMVGDVDQIASVGPGKVLKDMIDSKTVPCILLKEGHRNSGTIAHNAELINSGYKLNRYCYDEHFRYTPCTADNIASIMLNDYVEMVKKYGIKDVMLCAAMRERGPVAVEKLNAALQERFTSGNKQAQIGKRIFRVGDRVMQTKNDYNFVKIHGSELVSGVFNGERGSITNITYDYNDEIYKITVEFDDGSFGGYTDNTAVNLTLAYATTLHKCQGSEADCMMMAYTYGDYMLLNRSLFYTGETRAKKEFRFYGEEKAKFGKVLSAFDMAVTRMDDSLRNTSLKELLQS